MSEFFEHSIEVSSLAFSAHGVPPRLSHLVDNYTTVDYVDEYTFHLMKHIVDTFFHQVTDEEEKDLGRMKLRRRERRRLGLPVRDECLVRRYG